MDNETPTNEQQGHSSDTVNGAVDNDHTNQALTRQSEQHDHAAGNTVNGAADNDHTNQALSRHHTKQVFGLNQPSQQAQRLLRDKYQLHSSDVLPPRLKIVEHPSVSQVPVLRYTQPPFNHVPMPMPIYQPQPRYYYNPSSGLITKAEALDQLEVKFSVPQRKGAIPSPPWKIKSVRPEKRKAECLEDARSTRTTPKVDPEPRRAEKRREVDPEVRLQRVEKDLEDLARYTACEFNGMGRRIVRLRGRVDDLARCQRELLVEYSNAMARERYGNHTEDGSEETYTGNALGLIWPADEQTLIERRGLNNV